MIALTLATAAMVAVLLVGEWRESWLRVVAKPLASAGFVAVALAAGAWQSGYGRWVLAALVLSWIGDVALLGTERFAFLAGLVAFAAAHAAYTVGFGARGLAPGWLAVALLAAAAPGWAVWSWLAPHVPGPLRRPVAVYIALISLMVAAAVATVVRMFDWRIPLAALAFYLSDLAVARRRFLATGRLERMWGLPLYYAAQLLFAWTV